MLIQSQIFYILTNIYRKSKLNGLFSALWTVNFFVGKKWNLVVYVDKVFKRLIFIFKGRCKNFDFLRLSTYFCGMLIIKKVDKYFCFCYNSDMQSNVEEMLNEHKDEFGKFKTILTESNKKFNLTAISDENEVKIKHFYDSIAPERFFKYGARVAEIGSGGGFPSVPLMIVRKDLKFTLIESTGKKCDYLKEVVESLSLNCEQVLNIRAEDGAKDPFLREKFDVVTARAVAKLNTLSEYCLPYVKVGGTFIAYKGDGEDIGEAEKAISILGGKIEEIFEYELPDGYGKRRAVIIKKVSATPSKYPRGNGKERKNPL